MNKKIILTAILSAAVIVASFFIFSTQEVEPPPENIEPAKNEIAVYVSGQVKTPAVITLEDSGSLRLVDAVNAAGGMTELADTEAINLAEPLSDGQHIHVPTKEIFFRDIAAQASGTNSNSNSNSNGLININTADAKELEKLKGVGPAIAGRIIEYRESNGAFKSIEEIKKVRGIGEKTFEKMRDEITV
ncbi:MAG: helix-hairpin-helix domain-containing protein [Selenomonadaceae bacterium]|nr:helix-hairpin-helix domain-containing protein [Selenomonadaceae bacterium]